MQALVRLTDLTVKVKNTKFRICCLCDTFFLTELKPMDAEYERVLRRLMVKHWEKKHIFELAVKRGAIRARRIQYATRPAAARHQEVAT